MPSRLKRAGPPPRRSAGLPSAGALALAITIASAPLNTAAQAASVEKGRLIFESRCVACHSLDTNRVGPALGAVFGRPAGKASGFDYSIALAAATHVWRGEQLLAWLKDPEAVVPGQAMGYRVELAGDRQDVVAFLASLATHAVAP